MIVRILLLFIALFTFGVQAQAIKESYAFAVLGEPRYAFNFNHFDYVNPAAPKGGQITLSALGTFDNFNRYALRGNPGARTEQLYDTLFTTSDDEPGSYYPLIAESARYADDYSWVEVAINPRARFHDGSPITARDVEFTFQKFMTEGVPQFRLVYKGTTVKAIAPLTVRIELAKPGKEDMLSLFSLPVFPEKYWKDHKLSDPLATPPLASGPYRITSWKMGQNIVYSRVKDYWAANSADAGISTPFATIITSMIMSPLKRLKQVPLICVWKTTPKTGPRVIPVKISIKNTSSKMSKRTNQPRIRAGWRLISNVQYSAIAGCGKQSLSPLTLNG